MKSSFCIFYWSPSHLFTKISEPKRIDNEGCRNTRIDNEGCRSTRRKEKNYKRKRTRSIKE